MLKWPLDKDTEQQRSETQWYHSGSNLVLDIHGDPQAAQLTVFSDGNHHMALSQCMESMPGRIARLEEILYLTLPPPVLKRLLDHPRLRLGNLKLELHADIIISPLPVLTELCQTRRCREPTPFASHKGCAFLVAKNNPKKIKSYSDLLREDVRLFLSNPDTESVSNRFYTDYILAQIPTKERAAFISKLDNNAGVIYGECIHHREAVQMLEQGHCDVAILYRHLAIYYHRLFAEQFDLVIPKSTSKQPFPAQPYAAALVENGGDFGRQALDYLLSPVCKAIYEQHELIAM